MLSNDGQTDRVIFIVLKNYLGGGTVQRSQCSVLTALRKSVLCLLASVCLFARVYVCA